MTELPYDVWMLIVEYLPAYQVRRLYSVNKALFNIAMDLRYNHVSLGVLPHRVVEETQPPVLSNPLLCSRPTDLHVTFYDSSNHSGPNVVQTNLRSSSRPLLRTIIDETIGRKPKPIPATLKLAQLAEHVIPRLIRVTRLSFVYAKLVSDDSEGPYDGEASLVFSELLSIVGSRLRALHIQSHFALYLPPRPELESLETFSLDACEPYHTLEIHRIMLEKIPAFLLAQSSTIRKVSLTIDNATFDISPILRCLQLIPHLQDISLPFPYAAWSVRLASSRKSRPDGSWGLGTYIRQFSSSLVSLTLSHQGYYNILTSQQIGILCKLLGNFPCLQDLSLSIYNFNILDLVVFASTLPRLHSLFLDYYSVSMSVYFGWDFRPEMFNWGLVSFDYRCPDPTNDDRLCRKVALALPNVVWVHKKARSEHLLRR